MMRLICPNCDAQYEVTADAIPAEGRDVQCSNCGHAWFQPPLPTVEMATAELYREPEAAQRGVPNSALRQEAETPSSASVDAPGRRKLDDDLMAVLREEAEREIAARKADRIEMQDDLGLPEPEPVKRAPKVEEPAEELSVTERRIASMQGKPLPRIKSSARRDMFPDIEEINSTLRPSNKKILPSSNDVVETEGGSSGFRSGFVLALVIGGAAAAIYVMAPQLSEQIPALRGPLEQYVGGVDLARVELDNLLRNAAAFLKGLTAAKG